MTANDRETLTDDDGWSHANARYVGPDEWLAHCREYLDDRLYLEVLPGALAEAADDSGQLIDFRMNEFYERELSNALRTEDDPDDWTLCYDRFAAFVIQDAKFYLGSRGLLASRGNGDSVDYRLCLPAETATRETR